MKRFPIGLIVLIVWFGFVQAVNAQDRASETSQQQVPKDALVNAKAQPVNENLALLRKVTAAHDPDVLIRLFERDMDGSGKSLAFYETSLDEICIARRYIYYQRALSNLSDLRRGSSIPDIDYELFSRDKEEAQVPLSAFFVTEDEVKEWKQSAHFAKAEKYYKDWNKSKDQRETLDNQNLMLDLMFGQLQMAEKSVDSVTKDPAERSFLLIRFQEYISQKKLRSQDQFVVSKSFRTQQRDDIQQSLPQGKKIAQEDSDGSSIGSGNATSATSANSPSAGSYREKESRLVQECKKR